MTLLATRGLSKSFGGIQALDDVSVDIENGELVGLIGPNGAGKTTFFNCVTGFLEPTAGSVYFGGEEVTGYSSAELAHEGMVRSFQHSRAVTTLSVLDNVRLAAPDHPGERTLRALAGTDEVTEYEREITRRAEELLERFDLAQRADEYAGRLSGGQRKLLEVARALMLDPDLLMLDEPYAGIDEETIGEISAYIKELNDEGMTFLVIEHGLESLVELVDRLIVLNQGEVLADGPTEEVVRDEQVIKVYTGEPLET
ncbi:MAG: ABC transporter ATP-binding protein [Haloferacaceae archaeon]